jgi:serine/threonine protein kinase
MSEANYFRRCPSCGKQNSPTILRCECGTMLAGVDIVAAEDPAAAPPEAASEAINTRQHTAKAVVCSYADCAQPNPPGSTQCLYCDRPLAATPTPGSLINLPGALRQRYRIVEPMPTRGAEAELLIVQAVDGGAHLVAKIYRHGILPKSSVQDRIARVDKANRVEIFEHGVSNGYAYELMEYCRGGSLRTLLDKSGRLPTDQVRPIIRELSLALSDLHQHGLVHRDLKPENILIRQLLPLDLVLTDFGIASILDTTQRYTGVAHTLPYASPESLSGVIDAKADYWALGMIVLEASTGQHPFKNLSDAVILHYLTTRTISTSEINDPNLAKLARGLLQRDPAQRWGADELKRWLANDATLPEPNRAGSEQAYQQPYHIGDQTCYQPEQLGVALAHNWEAGITDISNGQLLAWFRDVQKDQNVVRLLLTMRSGPTLSVDIQLLTLILHLAPGIPPIWHGKSIALSAILGRAAEILRAEKKGDDEAARWLNELYQYRVLDSYAKAGNSAAAEIAARWNGVAESFYSTWDNTHAALTKLSAQRSKNQHVNIDQLMYGSNNLHRPRLGALHAEILAYCYDGKWVERQRQRITAELTPLCVQCPALVELGDPKSMRYVELLAIDNLLPDIRKIAAQSTQQADSEKQRQQDQLVESGNAIITLVSDIRNLARDELLDQLTCDNILKLCTDYFDRIAEIRASARSDLAWQDMRRAALRHERNLHVLMDKVSRLTERNAINAGWINPSTIPFAFVALVIMLVLTARTGNATSLLRLIFFSGAGLLLAWRYGPVFLLRSQIRDIARNL